MLYPTIKGDLILFSEQDIRDLHPLELPGVTHDEYEWLRERTPNLVYIPENGIPIEKASDIGAVALFREGSIQRNPENTLTAVFYDNLISEIGEVRRLLEQFRQEKNQQP
ncbi:MAG: hypothetical protein KAT77_02985 [Nanoarchaeota archaeon]|nr:hypothetical protein [Nanoarchaeota archaeon]